MRKEQLAAVSMLATMKTDDSLRRGAIMFIAKKFGVAHSTVYHLWERAKSMHELCIINSPGFISCKNNSRRRVMYPTEFVQESVKHVPLRKRLTQQKPAKLLGVSIMTVHCWIAALTIQVHCNKLKPILTEKNKWARLEMALSFVDPTDPTKFRI